MLKRYIWMCSYNNIIVNHPSVIIKLIGKLTNQLIKDNTLSFCMLLYKAIKYFENCIINILIL